MPKRLTTTVPHALGTAEVRRRIDLHMDWAFRRLEAEKIRVNAVSPGHTRTRLTGFSGTDTVEEGAAEIVRLALLRGDEGATGVFTHATHGVVPW